MSRLLVCLLLLSLVVYALTAPSGVEKREADPEPHHRRKFKLKLPHKLRRAGGGSESFAQSYSHSFSGPFGSYASSGSFAASNAGHG